MNVLISSYNSYGELTIIVDRKKEYTYYDVTQYHLEQIRRLIDRKDVNLWAYLKPFGACRMQTVKHLSDDADREMIGDDADFLSNIGHK